MGFPTANIDPESPINAVALSGMQYGVYFGWACLHNVSEPVGVALNVGCRPTIEDGEQVSIEAHVLRRFDHDFYGEEMCCLVLGFLRTEQRFESLVQLVAQIKEDVCATETALTDPYALEARNDPRLLTFLGLG